MADDAKTVGARHFAVIGSVNLDLVARVSQLPRAGETVTDAKLSRFPGGKGANQALAARRLGSEVTLLGCVGADAAAGDALALLKHEGVNLERMAVDKDTPTGLALISVAADGDNQIVVAPGANRCLTVERLDLPVADALLCQLEIPVTVLLHAARTFRGFFCINLAPVRDVPHELLSRADLIVVNELEAAHYGELLHDVPGWVAVTCGKRGAQLCRDGRTLAAAVPPEVAAVDTTGAGDTFTAALALALVEGQSPEYALQFACAGAAASTCRHGAQPAMPHRSEVVALLARESVTDAG